MDEFELEEQFSEEMEEFEDFDLRKLVSEEQTRRLWAMMGLISNK